MAEYAFSAMCLFIKKQNVKKKMNGQNQYSFIRQVAHFAVEARAASFQRLHLFEEGCFLINNKCPGCSVRVISVN